MPRQENSKRQKDGLSQYRNKTLEEREARFHENAEEEDPYDWRKRPSSPESRKKKTVRKLGTSGRTLKSRETTGDERTKFKTRNGVTWRVTKTEEDLAKEAEIAAEKEALRKKHSYEHRLDKGRPAYTRYVIKLNVVGYPKPYYYGGDEIGWTTYECAVQYLGKKKSLGYAKRLINRLKLEDNTDRFDSIEVVSIPKEVNKEWLFVENIKGVNGSGYDEESISESHEEYVERRKAENEIRTEISCDNCKCKTCCKRDPMVKNYCDVCFKCKKQGEHKAWKDECEKYKLAKSAVTRKRLC